MAVQTRCQEDCAGQVYHGQPSGEQRSREQHCYGQLARESPLVTKAAANKPAIGNPEADDDGVSGPAVDNPVVAELAAHIPVASIAADSAANPAMSTRMTNALVKTHLQEILETTQRTNQMLMGYG